MIKLTGIADEAGASLDVQIKTHQDLGWDSIESRVVEIDGVKGNLHEIPDAAFDKVCEKLAAANMKVVGFGSLIGNWAKKIGDATVSREGDKPEVDVTFPIVEGQQYHVGKVTVGETKLFTAEEIDHVRSIERFIGTAIKRVKRDGFNYLFTALFNEAAIPQGGVGKGVRTAKGYSFGARKRR